jgi:glycosyltransferase involved in cell wall biosynthesis
MSNDLPDVPDKPNLQKSRHVYFRGEASKISMLHQKVRGRLKRVNEAMAQKLDSFKLGETKDHAELLLMSKPTDPGYPDLAAKVIEHSGMFDAEYYLTDNTDVRNSGMDPLAHYILYGGKEGRRPSKKFDADYYLRKNADVREMGINPLIHYILLGAPRGASPIGPKATTAAGEYSSYIAIQNNIKANLSSPDLQEKKSFNAKAKPILDQLLESHEKIVVYPLSYPREVVQRPDHLFRYLGEQNVPTVILDNTDTQKPFFKEIRTNIYVTNLFNHVIGYLQDKPTALYITYPLFATIVPFLKPNSIIYDVVDDLTTFSGSLRGLKADHERLLKVADTVMYASTELKKKDTSHAKNKYIVENGVWPEDFRVTAPSAKYSFKRSNEKVIGYYGAVSNLLDWQLLLRIAELRGVRLVFIGPKADFANARNDSKDLMHAVLERSNVSYVDTVPYSELPKYASRFDAAIVPFEVNEITHPVSPLKLFEYMALGLKVFATPTKTLLEYKDWIAVAQTDDLLEEIKQWVGSDEAATSKDYAVVLENANWRTKFNTVPGLLAALPQKKISTLAKKVDIINVNFYDWEGKVLYKGGAERYVFDLARILIRQGHTPRILQNATKPFTKLYRGIEVVGVVTGSTNTDGPSLRKMSVAFNRECSTADMVIASPVDLACEIDVAPVIGINHGIHWDSKLKRLSNNRASDYSEIFDALSNITTGVCVDTNFINWTRTYDYSLGEKLKYIPNYFDGTEFRSTPKDFKGRLKVMYPRRLYDARGIYITLKAFDYLLDKFDDIDLLLVGQTTDKDVLKNVKLLMKKYEGRVSLEEYDMEDMSKAYKKSNVVLIPTRYAEGTSLSGLEAMATNNALIVTNIGGLPNLVIDNFNGLLIDPTAQALIEAVESVARDRAFAENLAQQGIQMAQVFEKKRWDARWAKLLEEVL